MNRPAATPRVTAALILVQILFGVHYYAAKVVLLEIPPRAWAFVRVAAAALLLLPLAVAFAGRRSLRLSFEEGWLEQHALTRSDLDAERAYLDAAGLRLEIE